MQKYAYDTNLARKHNIPRSPEDDLKFRGWDGLVMQPADKDGIILFTAEKVVVSIFDLPKHINPVAE